MKIIKILAAALTAIGALLVGLYLPNLIVHVQSSQQPQSYPIEIVDLENITEDASVAQMLSLVYNRGFSATYYTLSKGRYLSAEDVEKICTDMANQIFKEDIAGFDIYFEAEPNLCALSDGTSYVLWKCELWACGCRLDYLVDDATSSVLAFEINDDSNMMLDRIINGTQQADTEYRTMQASQLELLNRIAEALRQNLGYDEVNVTQLNMDFPYDQHYVLELGDTSTDDIVGIPVAVYDQYYLCVNQ